MTAVFVQNARARSENSWLQEISLERLVHLQLVTSCTHAKMMITVGKKASGGRVAGKGFGFLHGTPRWQTW
jgi:hypothetical protein